MSSNNDSYLESLDEMIKLFQDYKPGSITLNNITKLCQSLGLESFIDDINSQLSRLSTASKIIVVDIDFDKVADKVKDVKLVLASNFDNFNYFNDEKLVTDGECNDESHSNNILLNSLTQYHTLHEFHHNLQYIYLLDTFSQIDGDLSNTNNGQNGNGATLENGTTTPGTSAAVTTASESGKLDLFKYYTELYDHVKNYLLAKETNLEVKTNLNDMFGIYILMKGNPEPVAKLYLEKSSNSNQRLFEFVFSEKSMCWLNETSENHTLGICLVLEIVDSNTHNIKFPKDLIPPELILDRNDTENGSMDHNRNNSTTNEPIKLNNSILDEFSGHTADFYFDDNLRIVNDFTTTFMDIKKFDVSNDNLELILEILKWTEWYKTVLESIHEMIHARSTDSQQATTQEIPFNANKPATAHNRRKSSSSAATRRRLSSTKNKKPAIAEATMLKEEGLQQFTLNEILAESAINSDTTKMDIDNDNTSTESSITLILSENHVSIDQVSECSFYDTPQEWQQFIETLKNRLTSN